MIRIGNRPNQTGLTHKIEKRGWLYLLRTIYGLIRANSATKKKVIFVFAKIRSNLHKMQEVVVCARLNGANFTVEDSLRCLFVGTFYSLPSQLLPELKLFPNWIPIKNRSTTTTKSTTNITTTTTTNTTTTITNVTITITNVIITITIRKFKLGLSIMSKVIPQITNVLEGAKKTFAYDFFLQKSVLCSLSICPLFLPLHGFHLWI